MVFVIKIVLIIVGVVVERMKFVLYIIYSFMMCGLIYLIYGYWVWGGGWLSVFLIGVGVKDFVGCVCVYIIGGIMVFVGVWILGFRKGKYNLDGMLNVILGYNFVYVVIGILVFVFGWFGFNVGSMFVVIDLCILVVVMNIFIVVVIGVSIMFFV